MSGVKKWADRRAGGQLPRGVVSAGGANISVPNIKSEPRQKAADESHLRYLAKGINSQHEASGYDRKEADEAAKRADLKTAAIEKFPKGVSAKDHLNASLEHMVAARALRSAGGAEKEVHEHVSLAKEHAESAGSGYWEDSKHPRDEQGRFK